MKLIKAVLTLFTVVLTTGISNAQYWNQTGNGSTDSTTDFLGTTNARPLIFKTNSGERMRLFGNGNLSLGSTPVNPGGRLVITGGTLPTAVSNNAGINFLTSNAGRLLPADGFGVTGVITTFLDASNLEISSGAAAGMVSGMTLNAGPAGLVRLWTTNTERLRIISNGNVGIGTTTPSQKLTVAGRVSAISNNTYGFTHYSNNSSNTGFITTYKNGADSNFWLMTGKVGTSTEPDLIFGTSGYERMRISSAGNVILVPTSGTIAVGSTCVPAGYIMSVKGNIICEKLKVKPYGTCWADYVFAPNYQLLSLNEVETFIKQNKHLPGVPNAKEVDENGVEMVEMDATLLKKIEELTLYMIEQDKKLADQNKRLEKLERENMELKSGIK